MSLVSVQSSRATIKEVAHRAGVSIATVSRVFNNVGSVEEGTRERVKEAAAELRYVPNAAGRSLSTKRTEAVGLVLPDLFGEFFSEVIRGADQTAQRSNYHLLVSSSHSNRNEIVRALKMMRGRVDGLVIMSPHIDAETLNETLPHGLPVTLLNCYVKSDTFDSLNIDNYGGAYQIVRHLLDHGHRRIATIKGTEQNIDARERLRGYRQAILDFGAEHDGRYERPGDFSESSGYEAIRAIISLSPPPTAVFASNDSMAIGALSALRDAGVDVPSQVALAGFDDIPICAYLTPSLTTVHVGVDQLGAIAIRAVLRAVSEGNAHTKTQSVLPTRLTVRESCGCKPGR